LDSSSISSEPPQWPLAETSLLLDVGVSGWIAFFISLIVLIIFILLSGMFSAAENAFFSLTTSDIDELNEEENANVTYVNKLLQHPKHLLGTVLIANTFVNISIVMISTYMLSLVFNFESYNLLGFFVEVVFITFIIVLFGEVIPKIYAVQNNKKLSLILSRPMYYTWRMLNPLVYILVRSTSIIDKRVTKKGHILSMDELSHAIDITAESDTPKEEKTILKSIINFGNTDVKSIMKQRPDISALDAKMPFREVLTKINALGYSRVPVYKNNLDNVIGILYIKDLLPHIDKENDFNWITLIRKPYFVPESKMIDDLLKDFQNKRVHMALVVDEFGGVSGIITMEDILEEIFGEINDEFDEDEVFYSKINDNTFVFEAKILINDMCRYMEIEPSEFEEIRNESDTLGGLLLEINGEIPLKGATITYNNYEFIVESVDKRRIKRVKVTRKKDE
jgi:gliding motility-associated protein GldE